MKFFVIVVLLAPLGWRRTGWGYPITPSPCVKDIGGGNEHEI
jgi:hypothetical protein